MAAYIGDTLGQASQLFNSDQEAQRRLDAEATNQAIASLQQNASRAQQARQFQQKLAQDYQLSDAANRRQALMFSLGRTDRQTMLDDRAQQIKDNEAKTAGYEADKKHTTRYNAAIFEAQNGTYDAKNYSDLPQEEQTFLERVQGAIQKPVTKEYNKGTDLASAGDQYHQLQADISAPPVTAGGSHWYNPLTWLNSSAPTIQPSDHALAVRNQLAQAMPQVLQQGVTSGTLVRNPLTGGYVNAAPVPANIRYVPQLPPPGGGTNSVPLTPGMGAPTNAVPVAPMAAPQQAVSGYIVGKVYGGLRYMGGNPNDEASWQRFRGREPVE